MGIRYWKRMREQAADDSAGSFAPAPNPWVDEETETVIDLELGRTELSASERAAQYTEWADRMRQKRQRNRDVINGVTAGQTTTSYWTTEALFADSKQVAEDELTSRPNPWRVHELLSIFDLEADAAPNEIGDAYRRLAKQHHPDHYAAADSETQRFHADKMTSINRAYRALKELQRV